MALIDRIKYDGPEASASRARTPWLVYKHPSEELVLGSQLIVNKSQEAVFFKGGNALDVFGPGTHTLSTANLPLLRKLVNLPFGGQTPFTAEIYFINKTAKLDMKWGTPDPFQITEPRYQIIVSVRSFGQFGIKIADSRNFTTQIVGALHGREVFDYETISGYFKGLVVSKIKTTIAEMIVQQKVSLLDITALLDSISVVCRDRISGEFDRFGIEILNFFIESISIPEADLARVKRILEDRAEFNLLGDDRYTRKRSLDVLETTAGNEGAGGAAMGTGLGLGLGLGAGSVAGGAMGDVTRQLRTTPAENKIRCSKCGVENHPDSKFCSGCGEKIQTEKVNCPSCKAENPAGAKFCQTCGTSLTGKKCAKCAHQNAPEAKFCADCGSSLEG
jgi:membrane protease subunit (stomatin/prohibitin family)